VKPLKEWIQRLFAERYPRKVIFRVDAGRVYGLSFGHLSRCLVLSKTIKSLSGCESIFLMRDYAEGVNHACLSGEKVRTIPLNISPAEESEALVGIYRETGADWLVVDLPYRDMDTSSFPTLREQGGKILFIDDDRFINPGVDAILNSNILAPTHMEKVPAGETGYFLGPDYFIFDEDAGKGPPVYSSGYLNVLLTFGGSDPTGVTIKVLDALLTRNWPETFFRIILGPGYEDPGAVKELLKGKEGQYVVEVNPPNLISYLLGADLTVSAGGRTTYELLHLNRRFLPIATSESESAAVAALERHGFVPDGMTCWDQERFLEIVMNTHNSLQKEVTAREKL
jgi:spore coat polysaccharide biosynthesis predicted glycosyltransferase SpsG